MKKVIRAALERRLPGLYNIIHVTRNRRVFKRKFSQLHSTFKELLFSDNSDIHVLTGPFKGMHYFDEIVWGSITPKWLGSYEAELHAVIHAILERRYQTIIDVGCAEGYYAVGLTRFSPGSKVFAFDTDFISRKQIARLSALNNVTDRLEVRTFCGHADLEALRVGSTLVVCDIEGFEGQLLDPEKAPALRRCDILVEVHETPDDATDMEKLLHSRFAPSHKIERLSATTRDAWVQAHRKELPGNLSIETLLQATEENRASGRVWLWMQANQPG